METFLFIASFVLSVIACIEKKYSAVYVNQQAAASQLQPKPFYMQRFLFFTLLSIAVFYSCKQTNRIQQSLPSAIPVLKVKTDTGVALNLQISKLLVDVQVTGNVATTVFDITFTNPLDRVLEGEFEFPLADGQNISRYALEVDGHLREGVVVEKEKARVAFENTVRRNIDPGLVEKTKGNNFRTRVYPIPAKGEKRVLIGIDQLLEVVDKALVYRLPLYLDKKLQQFSIQSLVQHSVQEPKLQENQLKGFKFENTNSDWKAAFAVSDFLPQQTVAFSIPFNEDNGSVFTGDYKNATAFFITTPVQAAFAPKATAATVALFWDISASAEKRNLDKEIKLVEQYAQKVKDQQVILVPFNITTKQPERFEIQHGDAGALVKRLKEFSFDGGTQLGAVDLTKHTADEILLFTDGLSTFGKAEMVLGSIPVTVVNSSLSADHAYLKFIASQTHGRYLDLTRIEVPEAVNNMDQQALQFISATYNNNEIEEVYPATAMRGGFSIAGIMKTATAGIQLNYGYGNTITQSQQFTITKNGTGYGNISKIWAGMKIDQLDMQYKKNRELITALGKEFSIVTQNTSLIVLDRIEDYVQYEITPPAELREQYYTLLKEKQATANGDVARAFDEALNAMLKMKDWWGRDYLAIGKKNTIAVPPQLSQQVFISANTAVGLQGSFATVDSTAAFSSTTTNYAATLTEADKVLSFSASEDEGVTTKKDEEIISHTPPAPQAVPANQIELNEWQPDVPYLKQLEKTSPSQYFTEYVLLKKQYRLQPSFYADVARFLFNKKQQELSLQVLSNINELKLEDAELLRIVANQLLEMGELDLAVETFKEVVEIRAEQPQSYRDLALAQNEAGNYNEAVKLLYKVATQNWDNRFGEVKAIALNEMNAIISSRPQVNTAGMDRRLINAMPVDVRIVIGWSADNSDIDLWVTDPRKEKCYYSDPETSAGGRISNDVTQGYGPEEYQMKKALNGNYQVEINLFGDSRQTLGGPVTVKAELFTNFGRPGQKREVINFRLTGDKEVIRIGTLNFKG